MKKLGQAPRIEAYSEHFHIARSEPVPFFHKPGAKDDTGAPEHVPFGLVYIHRNIADRVCGCERRRIQQKDSASRMLARRLTTQGIEQFETYLSALRSDPTTDAPMELLTGSATSAALDTEVDATVREFHSRLEVAEHLNRILKIDSGTLRTDSGFWSWLALCWFETLCPSRNGRWQPGDRNRWIADLEDPRKACRHILAGPFQVYRAHRDDPTRALALLCGAPEQLGPLVTLIASHPSLVTCKAVVGAATRLYYDSSKGRNRPGLSGKGPGSPRRFADILSQLDLTWDLHSLGTDELLDLLPAEFDEFRRHKESSRQRPLIE